MSTGIGGYFVQEEKISMYQPFGRNFLSFAKK
jgi:hypothetical protein